MGWLRSWMESLKKGGTPKSEYGFTKIKQRDPVLEREATNRFVVLTAEKERLYGKLWEECDEPIGRVLTDYSKAKGIQPELICVNEKYYWARWATGAKSGGRPERTKKQSNNVPGFYQYCWGLPRPVVDFTVQVTSTPNEERSIAYWVETAIAIEYPYSEEEDSKRLATLLVQIVKQSSLGRYHKPTKYSQYN